MPSPHPLDEEDTHLARRLHAAGRVPLEQLSPLLNRARSQRAQDPEASLGRLLVNSGLISGDELEHLLQQDPALDERTLVAERPGAAPDAPAAPPHWHPGARVAGYVLEAELGRGGMGVVMRARHLGTGRLVALKGLLYDDLDGIERFTREVTAQAAADDHPNVVRVYEAGQAGRQCYLAMELLTGGDLAGRLKRESALAPREAAAVVAQLARGLAHVHAQGILHRDLKPQNVLFDGHGTPKLVDFGLARLQGVEGLTQTGQILGTPAYMAPEQALARDDVDARADVYGLGAILFACLTGRPPFQGQLADVLTRVVSEAPPQPSSLVPGLDPELEAICLRALSKRPGARYPDAASFAEALEAWGQDADRGSRAAPRGGRALALLASCAAGAFALGLVTGRATARPEAPAPAAATPARGAAEQRAPAPPQVEPATETPTAAEQPISAPPPNVAPDALEPWTRVMIPIPGERPDDDPVCYLGWVSEVAREGETTQVVLLVVGVEVGPLAVPERGFPADAFGVGASVKIHYPGRTRSTVCSVRRRLGPVALVELRDGDREWVPVTWLGLEGAGAGPGDDADAEVVLAPWAPNDQHYPAVVIDRDPAESRVRVAYLDGDTAWVPSEELRPLPKSGDAVHYKDAEDELVPATFGALLAPWIAEVVGPDRERVQLDLGRLVLSAEDR